MPRIIVDEAGKARRDEGGVVHRDRLLARETHHQRRHGNAVIHVGGDGAAARRTAGAADDQVVTVDLGRDSVYAQHGRRAGEAVGFLDPQLTEAAHAGVAFRESGGDRKDRIFVDHGRCAHRRHLDAAQCTRTHAQVGDLLAALGAALQHLDRRAHLGERREQPGTERVHHDAREDHLRARHDQCSDQRKCRGGWIGRHPHRRWRQFRLALERDATAAFAMRLGAHLRAEVNEHALGVVAGRLGLDHHCLAGRIETGEQHRGFDLRRRGLLLINDRDRIAGAGKRERQAAAVALLQRARPDALQWIEHAAHRAGAERSIPIEGRGDRAAAYSAEHQTAAGARVAEIEGRGRLGETAGADALDGPGALPGPDRNGAHRPHGAGRMQNVLAFEQTGDFGLADRQGAEDQRALRNRFIPRYLQAAAQRAAAACGHRLNLGSAHGQAPVGEMAPSMGLPATSSGAASLR